jgi:hypothetical protein
MRDRSRKSLGQFSGPGRRPFRIPSGSGRRGNFSRHVPRHARRRMPAAQHRDRVSSRANGTTSWQPTGFGASGTITISRCSPLSLLRRPADRRAATTQPRPHRASSSGGVMKWPCGGRSTAARASRESGQQPYGANNPLFGNAFCPLLGRNGASARLRSCSRKLGGL